MSRVPEVKLGQVAIKVLAADVVVSPINRPLELREVVLGLVGARSISDVLAREVVHEGMAGEGMADDSVGGAESV